MNNQVRDITKAITALQALSAKTQPSQVREIGLQLDIYEQHKDIAKEAAEIATDFLTEICASAAWLGNDDDSRAIRDKFSAHILDALDDVFTKSDAWAEEVREECEAA